MIVVGVNVGYYSAFIESQPLGTLVLLCSGLWQRWTCPWSELGCWHRTVAWSDGVRRVGGEDDTTHVFTLPTWPTSTQTYIDCFFLLAQVGPLSDSVWQLKICNSMAINVWWLWISFQPTLTYQSTQGWVTHPPQRLPLTLVAQVPGSTSHAAGTCAGRWFCVLFSNDGCVSS